MPKLPPPIHTPDPDAVNGRAPLTGNGSLTRAVQRKRPGALRCPHCRLVISPRMPVLAPHHCPRCLVRRRIAVELEALVPNLAAERGVSATLPLPSSERPAALRQSRRRVLVPDQAT